MRFLELRIPPLLLVLITGLLMWLAARAAPAFRLDDPSLRSMAIVPAVVGLVFAVLGVASFRRAHTTVNPLDPGAASTLVASGVYRFTRNPMYLGLLLLLSGWVLFLGNPIGGIFLPGFVAYMNRFQIGPEEAALTERFGEQFKAYRSRVRRWI